MRKRVGIRMAITAALATAACSPGQQEATTEAEPTRPEPVNITARNVNCTVTSTARSTRTGQLACTDADGNSILTAELSSGRNTPEEGLPGCGRGCQAAGAAIGNDASLLGFNALADLKNPKASNVLVTTDKIDVYYREQGTENGQSGTLTIER